MSTKGDHILAAAVSLGVGGGMYIFLDGIFHNNSNSCKLNEKEKTINIKSNSVQSQTIAKDTTLTWQQALEHVKLDGKIKEAYYKGYQAAKDSMTQVMRHSK